MTTDDGMTITERRKYLMKMQSRYRQADHQERSQLLTEMVAITGMHRKSLTRLMAQSSLRRTPRRRQRGGVYGPEITHVVRIVWESLDCICAERLTPQLLTTAQHLATFGELTLTPAVETLLAQMSESTVARGRATSMRVTDDDAGIVRGRVPSGQYGPSQRGKHGGRVCPHPATDRCCHRVE